MYASTVASTLMLIAEVSVAMIVPVPKTRQQSTREVIGAIREFRKGKTLGDLTIRDLVEDGRRY